MWGVTNTELGGSSGTKQEKKKTKAVTARGWERDSFSFIHHFFFFTAEGNLARLLHGGSQKQHGGCGCWSPGRSLALLLHPCSTWGLGSLGRARKAQGINLEGAAAASCSQTTRYPSVRKLNQLCAGSKRCEKCTLKNSGDFLPPLGQACLEFRSVCHIATHYFSQDSLIYHRLTLSCAHGLWHSQTPHSSSETPSKGLSGAHSPPQCNAQVAALGLLSRINAQFVEEVRSFHRFFPAAL